MPQIGIALMFARCSAGEEALFYDHRQVNVDLHHATALLTAPAREETMLHPQAGLRKFTFFNELHAGAELLFDFLLFLLLLLMGCHILQSKQRICIISLASYRAFQVSSVILQTE